jgi:hypothetical protein
MRLLQGASILSIDCSSDGLGASFSYRKAAMSDARGSTPNASDQRRREGKRVIPVVTFSPSAKRADLVFEESE